MSIETSAVLIPSESSSNRHLLSLSGAVIAWEVGAEEGHPRRLHVIPLGDLREHSAACDCWCRPQADDEKLDVWIHNSLDRRELYEVVQ